MTDGTTALRQIVLSLTSLWAHGVDASPHPDLTRVVLERGDAGSPALFVDLHDVNMDYAMISLSDWFATSRRSRIRSIQIHSFGQIANSALASHLNNNLPTLQALSISFHEHVWYDGCSIEELAEYYEPVIVETLAVHRAPALTEVMLHNCLLPWDADIFSNLTHLTLQVNTGEPRRFRDSNLQIPTSSEMRSLFISLRNIVDIFLDIFPNHPHPLNPDERELILVSLSCKRITLHSRGGYYDCCELACSLVMPPGASMTVFIAGNDYGRLLQMLSRPSQTTSVGTLGEKPWDWLFPPNYEEHLASDMYAGTVAIGAGDEDPSLLLQSPLEFLQFIPGSHYFFLYERAGLEGDDSESASEETFDPREDRHQDDVAEYMLSNLIQLDYSHVQVLRLSGLRYSDDVDRFYSIYDTFIGALRTARSVEVLVLHEMHSIELATLVQVLTDNPEYPVLPSLQAIAWSPSSIPDTSVIRKTPPCARPLRAGDAA
ncbi:hypothetical protein PENSPDRAFT_670755 [Peniophora sp. CONT]|nr:hypothetical protein PENSPDRAFT_670755 [Peniophora sp. CONT]